MIEVEKISGIGAYTKKRLACGRQPAVAGVACSFVGLRPRRVPRGGTGVASERPANRSGSPLAYFVNNRAFLVVNKNTIEVRTDEKLGKLLSEKYESVMRSRYFGRGGIEVVNAGQLSEAEINDLVRLSYNLTKEI